MKSHLIDKRNDSKLGVELSHVARLYANSFKPSNKDIETHNVLKRLRKNQDITILKPDKGNGVVILNKTDYIKGISDILNDSHKFKELTIDPTINREGKLQRFLLELKKKGKIDAEIYNNVYPSGPQPTLIYGHPKCTRLSLQLKYHHFDPLYPPSIPIIIV